MNSAAMLLAKPSRPDREAQFEHIDRETRKAVSEGNPVLSIDARKKKMIGNFKNEGQTWRPHKTPAEVLDPVRDKPRPSGRGRIARTPQASRPVLSFRAVLWYNHTMQRLQAYKYELMPNGEQQRQMRRFAGSCRIVFNEALALQ
ncbi:MAG: helix-turn-helix domain-containing protein, partial [Zoogloeaceae bacterium]|nr:helix-turn-helix domain-containing protein [Zoogloeaceae bacterium]